MLPFCTLNIRFALLFLKIFSYYPLDLIPLDFLTVIEAAARAAAEAASSVLRSKTLEQSEFTSACLNEKEGPRRGTDPLGSAVP